MGNNNQNFKKADKPKPPETPAPQINISKVSVNLFANRAQEAAQDCVVFNKDKNKEEDINKTTQIRRFYDELVLFHDKVFLGTLSPREQDEKFRDALPYIQMLRAKAAYAKGRNLINGTFFGMFDCIIKQIQNKDQLKTAKLFMEAFLGYKKSLEKK